jgi:hypothetical protein
MRLSLALRMMVRSRPPAVAIVSLRSAGARDLQPDQL